MLENFSSVPLDKTYRFQRRCARCRATRYQLRAPHRRSRKINRYAGSSIHDSTLSLRKAVDNFTGNSPSCCYSENLGKTKTIQLILWVSCKYILSPKFCECIPRLGVFNFKTGNLGSRGGRKHTLTIPQSFPRESIASPFSSSIRGS